VFDAEVNPGKTSEAQTILEPGQYVALAMPRDPRSVGDPTSSDIMLAGKQLN
jgi:hypothetical protein